MKDKLITIKDIVKKSKIGWIDGTIRNVYLVNLEDFKKAMIKNMKMLREKRTKTFSLYANNKLKAQIEILMKIADLKEEDILNENRIQ